MAVYVVYKSEVRKRVSEGGRVQHYVTVGLVYGRERLAEVGALEWTEHADERDASGAWDAYCYGMRQRWPRRAGMDVAEADKFAQGDAITIDGAHTKIEVDRSEPPKLF